VEPSSAFGDRGLPGDLTYRITSSSDLTRTASGAPMPASILSPRTTASGCSTCLVTKKNRLKPTAKTIGTATTIISAGIAEKRFPRTILTSRLWARQAKAESAGNAAAVPGRTDDVLWRCNRACATGKQERLLPGQSDKLAELEFAASGSRPAGDRSTHDQLRKSHPVFGRRRFFQRRPIKMQM
jgi:hypothetical protein